MMRRRRTGVDELERGFTLVELMIVILIISILIAIGIPVFWESRARATDRAAQTMLTNGVKAVQVVRSDNEGLATITTVQMEAAEPALAWVSESTPAEARQDEISLAVGTTSGTGYAVLSTHTTLGECLAIRVLENAPTTFQRVTGNTCPADSFDPAFGWVNKWPPR